MSKINKYANLYDVNGNLIRKVNDSGVLEDYSIEELEMLIDQLAADKDEYGQIKNPKALNYANGLLLELYYKHGNPHHDEIMAKLKEKYGEKSTGELVKAALSDLAETSENVESNTKRTETVMDEYVEPITE